MSQEPTITIKELDSYISEATNQLRSGNLLLEKLEAIAINKQQLTEKWDYLVEKKFDKTSPEMVWIPFV